MNLRKYLVLIGVTVFGSTGDALLSHGMKQIGSVSLHDLPVLFVAVMNPWVAGGILLLLAFFAAYMNALSWADLTYVLPASSLGYVVLAMTARFVLHEQVSPLRWMGIVLISGGVGFVAGGPALTSHGHHDDRPPEPSLADLSALPEAEAYEDEVVSVAPKRFGGTALDSTRHIKS